MNNFGEKVSFIWSVADLIRDTFKRGKYQDVILPLTVLRRLDCVLEPTKAQVLETYNQYKDKLENLDLKSCTILSKGLPKEQKPGRKGVGII